MADGIGGRISVSGAIDAAVSERAMLSHPFYQAWSAGKLTQESLREYSKQYYAHVEAFPNAVRATLDACDVSEGRALLAENLAEEEGVGEGKAPHAELWMDFAKAMGASRADVEGAALYPETTALIDAFRRLSGRSYAAGLGALYAYECQLPAVASTKIDGLDRFYGVNDADAIRFFTVHEAADVEHASACRDLLNCLPETARAEAVAGGAEMADALWGFLSGVQRETKIDC